MTETTETRLVTRDDGAAMRAMALPENRDHMFEMVERAFNAGLVPTSYKSVEAAFLATLKGAEFGLLPQQSLQGFCVVNNVAHPWGTCLRGIVQASSTFEGEMDGCIEGVAELAYMAKEPNEYKEGSLDHALFRELQRALRRRQARIEGRGGKVPEHTYFCGYSVVKRRGQEPYCVLWDTFDAQRAEQINKTDVWKKFPVRMYQHKASTFARRDRFSSVLIGLDMTAEEALEVIEVTAVEVPRSSGGRAAPTTTGAVLDDLAAAKRPTVEDAEFTVRQPASPATRSAPPTPPPAPVEPPFEATGPAPAGFVPVGEPGASEADDKDAVQRKPTPATAAPASEPKANGKASIGAQRLKTVTQELEGLVKDKTQINEIAKEAKRDSLGNYEGKDLSHLPSRSMTDDQKDMFAAELEKHVSRLKAQREPEANDPTDF